MGNHGIDLIAAERIRQMHVEGWTPEHDAKHDRGELAKAAACYAVYGTDAEVIEQEEDAWPWSEHWDKRRKHEDIRRLSIAGALIAAEIDRILRAENKSPRKK